MTRNSVRIGDIEVILICDGAFEAPVATLIHQDGEAARQEVIRAWDRPNIGMDVNCFVLRDETGITLIDTGAGSAWGPKFGQARQGLAEVGISPDDVDRILLTHIHGDHGLGLFEGDTLYFPRADLLVPEVDLAFFTSEQEKAAVPEARRGGFDLAARICTAYGDRLKQFVAGPVHPGVEAISLPGHTPGHTGFLIGAEQPGLLIWTDAIHLAEIQAADPKIGLVYDVDPNLAVATRIAIFEQAVRENWIVAGSHVTGFNRVRRSGESFEIVAA